MFCIYILRTTRNNSENVLSYVEGNYSNKAGSNVYTNVLARPPEPASELSTNETNTKNTLARPPESYTGASDVASWFSKVEQYLKGRVPACEWFDVVYSWVSDKPLKKLNMFEFGEGEQAYLKLKSEMLSVQK